MAKSRFRRKSYRKKTKTARRQKRKSRRMRGGALINRDDVIGWAEKNKNCNIRVFAPNFGREKLLSSTQVTDAKTFSGLKIKAGMLDLQPNEISFESKCDYDRNYGEYGPGPVEL